MRSLLALPGCVVIVAGLGGCGPLQTPMPPRPDAEGQKAIDEAWEKAIRPVGRFDHQALLDILLVTRAYEAGVDKLTFRSEKRVAAGKVVMEINYDRLAPADDRFEVQVLDGAGRLLRKERYGREEVERTYKELFVEYERLRKNKERGKLTPEEARERDGYEARMKVIEGVFPKDDREKDKGGDAGQGRAPGRAAG